MPRLSSPLAVVLLVASAACGGGGGSSNVEPPPQDIEIDLGVESTRGSAIVTFDAPAPAFEAGAVFEGAWLVGGEAVATGRFVAVSVSRLATVAPTTIPSGNYDLQIELGGAPGRTRGSARAALAATPWSTDPEGDILQFVDDLAMRIAALRLDVASLRDAALAASLTADLDRLDLLRMSFAGLVPTASLADQNALATLLHATAALEAAPFVPPASTAPLVDPEAMRQQVLAGVDAWQLAASALAVGGRVGRDLGFRDGGVLLAPGLVVAGGVQMVRAMVAAANGYEGLFAFADAPDLRVVEDGGAAPAGAAPPVTWLAIGSARRLGAAITLRSLVAADRQLLDLRVQGIFTVVDVATRMQETLAPVVTAAVATPFPTPPEVPRMGVRSVAGSVLTIVAQSNPLLQVALLDGRLLVTAGAENAPAATAVTFRLDAGEFGVATQTLAIDVLRLRAGMLAIPAGTYVRGSGWQVQSLPWTVVELPLANVTISRPFWMARCEVTQSEYAAVTGLQPSSFVGEARPVDSVSWLQAVMFCEALTASEAAALRLPPGHVYRLPTEAEWEYCCRAGTVGEWSTQLPPTCAQANFASSGGFCVLDGATDTVGMRAPNPWGLCDMQGNVLEWCADAWNGLTGYAPGAVVDPFVAVGPLRVLRGGGYASSSTAVRSAHRACAGPNESTPAIGFRVVCAPPL